MVKRRTAEQEKVKDILKGADLRAKRALDDYRSQREFDIGEVKTITYAGASVALGESGRYIKNMQSMRGAEIVVGSRVFCARIGRHDWIIIGSIERNQGSTALAGTDNIVAQPQNLTVTDKGGYASAEWDASHFDIAVWQMQIASASVDADFAPTHYTDNTQYDVYTDQALPYTMYMRVRAVGPTWDFGSPTAWVEFTITEADYAYFTGLLDTPSTYGGEASKVVLVNDAETALEFVRLEHDAMLDLEDDDHPQYLLTDGTRPDTGDFTYEGDLISYKNSANYTVYGFHPLSPDPLSSTSWDGDTFSTTAKTLIDLSAVFPGVPAGVKAVLVQLTVFDSGSAGVDCKIYLAPNNDAGIGLAITCPPVNNARGRGSHIVPCNEDGDIYYQIDASGAGTFTGYIQIWGYWI